ncbi:MAG TPA: ABC transporter ATP-binding protein [Clostridia bacterium]|nr:ABC transporter ATP-binding protein [Clostridia bacterium]
MERDYGILEIQDLSVSFSVAGTKTHVLDEISFGVPKGESIGIVGESGCGKTTTLRAILNVLPGNAEVEKGKILFNGKNIFDMTDTELQKFRRTGAGMIFQDPSSALNPVFTIEDQFLTTLKYANKGKNIPKKDLIAKSIQALNDVSLADPERILKSYPFQLSGGMRQRVCIAMTLAADRHLLLADEPGTALDVTIQDQILRLIKKLVDERHLSVVMVSHSLGVIRQITTFVNIMYAGTIVESGGTREVFDNPKHPYTVALINCLPKLTGKGIAEGIPGRLPDYSQPPKGCRFAPRCRHATEECNSSKPPKRKLEENHWVSCYYAGEVV